MQHDFYLKKAFEIAFDGIRKNQGGPFGAVIVKEGKIIAAGANQVTSSNDPTAHAEIVAIREAGKVLENFDLSDTVLYTTCQPCPMCLSAIYWAKIPTIYYCSTREDAEKIGFADNHIYNELDIKLENITKQLIQLPSELGEQLFNEWTQKADKIDY